MLSLHRSSILAAVLALLAITAIYAGAGTVKPALLWHWMDVVGEGGTALMSGVWFLFTLSSRPRGLVTRLLAGGLCAIMLGSWADCLDEFFAVGKDQLWDNWLEALMPLGMLILTAGMYYWRQEQFSLNEHLQKRERLFRDHRAFDRITQLAGADYLRSQIRAEQARSPGAACALVLLDIDSFHLINRKYGQREGDRVLQAVGHMLLLNLRNDDLLCRYAGDRFAILMPGVGAADADGLARHLCFMVGQMLHHGKDGPVRLTLRHASAAAGGASDSAAGGAAGNSAGGAADALLAELSRKLSALGGAAAA